MVYIGACKVFGLVLSGLWELGFLIFYTYAYSTLSGDLKGQPISIVFAIYIGLCWISAVLSLKPLFMAFKHYGETIDDDIWALLSATNKLCNLIELIVFGFSFYLMVAIGPFFASCGIYESNHLACVALQIIALFAFLETCLICLGLIILLLACICSCGNISFQFVTDNNEAKNQPLVSATQFLEKYNPIPNPESSTQCSICMETVLEDDHKEWTELLCRHRFHRECLARWYLYSQSCPHCRDHISLSDSVNV
jgi:hypothetical protein